MKTTTATNPNERRIERRLMLGSSEDNLLTFAEILIVHTGGSKRDYTQHETHRITPVPMYPFPFALALELSEKFNAVSIQQPL